MTRKSWRRDGVIGSDPFPLPSRRRNTLLKAQVFLGFLYAPAINTNVASLPREMNNESPCSAKAAIPDLGL